MNRFIEALHSGCVLVMDGAMGTELHAPRSTRWRVRGAVERDASGAGRGGSRVVPGGGSGGVTHKYVRSAFARVLGGGLRDRRLFHDPAPLVLADVGPLAAASNLDREQRVAILRSAGRPTECCWRHWMCAIRIISCRSLTSITAMADQTCRCWCRSHSSTRRVGQNFAGKR